MVTDAPELSVFDFTRVGEIAAVGWETLVALRDQLRAAGAEHVTVDPGGTMVDPDAAGGQGYGARPAARERF
ncbi:hypothetical protein [Actinomadura flavalba]|uniref:hypothetical protein n=1 Tax=Actinomadura flavalba TaxID=1120938 RepID=UPI0006871AFA|nr:hypothetical protein [Actinomadura flavalba]